MLFANADFLLIQFRSEYAGTFAAVRIYYSTVEDTFNA